MGFVVRVAFVGLACALSCAEVLDLDDYDNAQAATGSGGPASTGKATGGTGAQGGGGAGTGGLDCDAVVLPGMCGVSATAPSVACPVECDCSIATECGMVCDFQDNNCSGRNIDCPEGLDCRVHCQDDACSNTTILCPQGHLCSVICDGEFACQNTQVQCSSDGPCYLECQNDVAACESVVMHCGCNKCTAFCEYELASVPEFVDCATSCECDNCTP